MQEIEADQGLKNRWDKYRRDFEYAKDITYEAIMEILKIIANIL